MREDRVPADVLSHPLRMCAAEPTAGAKSDVYPKGVRAEREPDAHDLTRGVHPAQLLVFVGKGADCDEALELGHHTSSGSSLELSLPGNVSPGRDHV